MQIKKAQHVTYEFAPLTAEEMSDLKVIAQEFIAIHTTKATPVGDGEVYIADPVEDRRVELARQISRMGETARG